MATGQTRWADITSISNDLYDGAVFQLYQTARIIPTVRVFNDNMSMWTRKNTEYGAANPRAVGEGEDVAATKFTRSLLSSLTPATYADQFFLTDQRLRSDTQDVVRDAAMEQGAAFAAQADEAMAAHFSSLTGGTIGTAGGTITWSSLINARALMESLKIPGPYFCALHPFQWAYLVKAVAPGQTVTNAPMFQDMLIQRYYVSSVLDNVILYSTPSITVDASDDATGAMYARVALAYDVRQAFRVEPERDASRRGWEWNFNTDYATGVWVPSRGIQLIGDASTPTT